MKKKLILTAHDREKILENHIIEYLRIRGIYCQKIHSGAVFVKAGNMTYKMKLADRGTPDIFACYKGKLLCIEVKASPEHQAEWERQWQKHLQTKEFKKSWERSIYQHNEHLKWEKCGAEIIVCSSVDELAADIEQLERESLHPSL